MTDFYNIIIEILLKTKDECLKDTIYTILEGNNETIDNINLAKSLDTRYNEGSQNGSDDEEFSYDKVMKNLKKKQKQKKPVNIRDKQEDTILKSITAHFTDDELNDGCAVRYTSKYEYSLLVFSDGTYTIIHRKRLY